MHYRDKNGRFCDPGRSRDGRRWVCRSLRCSVYAPSKYMHCFSFLSLVRCFLFWPPPPISLIVGMAALGFAGRYAARSMPQVSILHWFSFLSLVLCFLFWSPRHLSLTDPGRCRDGHRRVCRYLRCMFYAPSKYFALFLFSISLSMFPFLPPPPYLSLTDPGRCRKGHRRICR